MRQKVNISDKLGLYCNTDKLKRETVVKMYQLISKIVKTFVKGVDVISCNLHVFQRFKKLT